MSRLIILISNNKQCNLLPHCTINRIKRPFQPQQGSRSLGSSSSNSQLNPVNKLSNPETEMVINHFRLISITPMETGHLYIQDLIVA